MFQAIRLANVLGWRPSSDSQLDINSPERPFALKMLLNYFQGSNDFMKGLILHLQLSWAHSHTTDETISRSVC